MAKRQPANPLDRIPRSKFIQQRLDQILDEAAKLKILLRTAKEIEAVEKQSPEAAGK